MSDLQNLRVRCGDHELDVYDTGGDAHRTALLYFGSPHTGRPFEPYLELAAARGIRLVGYARPGYGSSVVVPGSTTEARSVAAAGPDTEAILNAVGVEHAWAIGYSGGGPHAIAAAALPGGRIRAAAVFASLAPFTDADWWFAGMADEGSLRASVEGRAARTRYEETAEFDPSSFVDADYLALDDPWRQLGDDVNAAFAGGLGHAGLIDDDLSFVQPWDMDVADVRVPVRVWHGELDRVVPFSHGIALATQIPGASLIRRTGDGHVAVLNGLGDALDWLLEQ